MARFGAILRSLCTAAPGAAAARGGAAAAPTWTPPATLRYPVRAVEAGAVRPSGWVAPMGGVEQLPFRVYRTPKGKQLPVYTDYKNGRTRCLTVLRRFRGSAAELAAELSKVCDGRPVRCHPGRLEVTGNYARRVVQWLLGLGF